MSPYAEKTEVPVERTIAEILTTLRKTGCENYGHFIQNGIHTVVFTDAGRGYRMQIIPPRGEDLTITEGGRRRNEAQIQAAIEQEMRRRARVLLLLVKAKLEAAAIGATTINREFMGDMVLPTGQTMSDWAAGSPKLTEAGEPDIRLMLQSGGRR